MEDTVWRGMIHFRRKLVFGIVIINFSSPGPFYICLLSPHTLIQESLLLALLLLADVETSTEEIVQVTSRLLLLLGSSGGLGFDGFARRSSQFYMG